MATKKPITRNAHEISDEKERKLALATALNKIKKDFGEGAVMRMGDKSLTNIDVFSTGILSLDIALGVGGFPKGRIIEIYGPESSGKTTIALQAVASIQKAGGVAAYIDAENAMDPKYATALGVNIDELLLSQPDTGEQGLEIADALIQSGAVSILVVDSVAALVPEAEIEGVIGDSHVGLQARMMSQALRKLTASIFKTQTIVIFINQLREKIGVQFGNPETTPGGRALKFYATIRLDVRRAQQVKDGTNVIGNTTKIRVTKNKVAPPFRSIETTMSYGHGISHNGDMIALGVDDKGPVSGIIKKSGSWYSYNDERLGQGAVNAEAYLDAHPEMSKEIEAAIRKKAFPEPQVNTTGSEHQIDKAASPKKEHFGEDYLL